MAQAYLQFIILCLNFLSFVKKGNSDNQFSVSTMDVIQASIRWHLILPVPTFEATTNDHDVRHVGFISWNYAGL